MIKTDTINGWCEKETIRNPKVKSSILVVSSNRINSKSDTVEETISELKAIPE